MQRKMKLWLGLATLLALFLTLLPGAGQLSRPMAFELPTLKSEPLNIGSRRELFVDNYIIGALRGGATRKLFEMTPATTETKDVAMTHDADWEGPWCRYAKYIQDRGVIKAWYMGHHTYQSNKERLSLIHI